MRWPLQDSPSQKAVTMQVTILFRGIRGQIIFYDDRDRGRFVHVCSLLPAKGDFEWECCGKATHIEFAPGSATVTIEACDWLPSRIAQFVCDTYDAYLRLRYDRSGPQTVYEIMT